MSNGILCAFQQCENFENRLRFDKVIENLKVGTFFKHSVDLYMQECKNTSTLELIRYRT